MKTGQAYKIGDQVVAGATLGTLTGGHLHFQLLTFHDGGFDSTSTNTALANVTVGGKLLTEYRLGGNFQVTPSGDTYTVTGQPIKTKIFGQSTSSTVSFNSLINGVNTINSTISGTAATMTEGSPAYIWGGWAVPSNATFLSFEFLWGDKGDGDFLTVHFGDTLLFSFLGTDFTGDDFLSSGLLWIGQFAGQTGQLLFALNNVGEVNADLTLRNLTLYSEGQVPAPATIALFLIGLAGLSATRRRKTH